MKDWIDLGTLSLFYLRDGYVAQSGGHPIGHPIVVECAGRRRRWLRVNVSYVLVYGPWACLSDIPDQCCAEWSLLLPRTVPEMGIMPGCSPKIDTGGERRLHFVTGL